MEWFFCFQIFENQSDWIQKRETVKSIFHRNSTEPNSEVFWIVIKNDRIFRITSRQRGIHEKKRNKNNDKTEVKSTCIFPFENNLHQHQNRKKSDANEGVHFIVIENRQYETSQKKNISNCPRCIFWKNYIRKKIFQRVMDKNAGVGNQQEKKILFQRQFKNPQSD